MISHYGKLASHPSASTSLMLDVRKTVQWARLSMETEEVPIHANGTKAMAHCRRTAASIISHDGKVTYPSASNSLMLDVQKKHTMGSLINGNRGGSHPCKRYKSDGTLSPNGCIDNIA
eukprot:gnl/TRDRNA2_/TRDRNA2_59269_c0_seq1.p1 gnl/TRDRNA2_/TRDRNA2_59269_c0~~gnl/TRDRNA2_/TRDRNA2_59269_c0_seq1.p1  ORF type:complete len:118 (+),score=3.33 gnl/TRDRNA2_/TRDRNA2_59269_c0_seq1:122-475(+)